ncbi:MAG: hypothetical protein K6347_02865 [Campylobacterales bacterium]
MELKLAREELNAKPKSISYAKLVDELHKEKQKIFYFDRDNTHKTMLDLVEKLSNEGFSVYLREVRYGLDNNDYMYEVHAL